MAGKMTLILGGARSGKSAYAEQLASASGHRVLYVATAEAHDDEMAARIAAHRAQRPIQWQTVESPLRVGAAVSAALAEYSKEMVLADADGWVVLLDCLTLLANNVLGELPVEPDASLLERALFAEVDALVETWRDHRADWIVVSNEVGLGIVPAYPLGRSYRDALGRANQRLAAVADEVFFLVAGLPMQVK